LPDIEASANGDEARRALEAVAARAAVGLRRAFDLAGAFHQRVMAKRFVPYGSRDPIQTRSSALRESFDWETRGTGLDIETRLFAAGLPYIRAQEYGATIRPKNKRYLTVPLSDALAPTGVLKGGARLVPRGKGYQTADGAPTFVFRSRSGNLLVATRPRNGSSKLLYVLKPQVTLKPRLGFRETFRSQTLPFLRQRAVHELERALA